MEDPQINQYSERDLKLIAYLLSSEGVLFKGTKIEGSTVFCLFEPFDKASFLTSQYYAGQAPAVQPRILLEALENARTIVFKAKDEARVGVSNGGSTYERYR